MPKQEWYHKLISENEQDTQHDLAANIDISKPLAKNASAEEFCEYGFAAQLSDDDDKMHAALDSLLASDIGRSTMQEAAALYERQEQEEIARLEQMQHDAPAMRMTRG